MHSSARDSTLSGAQAAPFSRFRGSLSLFAAGAWPNGRLAIELRFRMLRAAKGCFGQARRHAPYRGDPDILMPPASHLDSHLTAKHRLAYGIGPLSDAAKPSAPSLTASVFS